MRGVKVRAGLLMAVLGGRKRVVGAILPKATKIGYECRRSGCTFS